MDTTQELPADPPEQVLARIPEVWGRYISCGPGWYGILERLDAELAAIDPGYVVLQVKEKFGGLRYYWEPSDGNVLACCARLEEALDREGAGEEAAGSAWAAHESGEEHQALDAARQQRLAAMSACVRSAEAEAWATCELTGGAGVLMRRGGRLCTLDPGVAGEEWARVE